MSKEKRKPINDEIKAKKVQLITETGENLGEMSLEKAKQIAEEKQLDLMEMGKNKDITIVKLLDYGKYLYKQKKQERKNRQKGKTPDLKTIRITFKISEHDLQTKYKQAEKFSSNGHPLKVTLMLKGRENNYTEIAKEKMEHFIKMLENIYNLDGNIKKTGNTFIAMFKPKK